MPVLFRYKLHSFPLYLGTFNLSAHPCVTQLMCMNIVVLLQGTFNPDEGLNTTDQCTPCTVGHYCGSEGLIAPSGACEARYYCPVGQNDSRPVDYPCPVGHYCPMNTSDPLPCANGTYMNHTLAEECYVCPEGWWVEWYPFVHQINLTEISLHLNGI